MSAAVTKVLEAGGQRHELVFKFGTLRMAEAELGKPIPSISGENFGFDTISAVLWAVLQPRHKITREASDDLVDHYGLEVIAKTIMAGLADYMSPGEDGADAAEAGNVVADPAPPKPKAKRKPRSS